jgi:trypsin-like peptidase/effector-associated domain 8 (EAD8)-containing protein
VTELDAVDRQALVSLLAAMPALEGERSRAHLLALAGTPAVDVSGPQADAAGRIVHYLTEYGRVPHAPHALGVFLNVVKGFSADQDFLADLLTRYDLATPVARVPAIGAWRGSGTDVPGAHGSWPVAFLTTAVEIATCVASVHVATGMRSWSGTGFLVGPDVLLTAGHVLPSPDLVPHTMFRFGDRAHTSRDDGLFHTSAELDYTLVQLGGWARDSWLPLTAETVAVGDRVSAIHHPGGLPTRISLGDNVVEYAGGSVTQYSTTTSAVSSGAPVFTDEWRVCAVHHASEAVAGARLVFHNEGITTAAILRDLPTAVRQALPG